MPIDDLHFIWPQAKGFICAALKREGSGRYEAADVLDALLRGINQLWIAWNDEDQCVDAAVVTELINYPRLRALRLWLIGGRNMRAWVRPMRDLLEEFARANECRYIEGGLRKGWIRIGGEGWHQTGVTFEKRLT